MSSGYEKEIGGRESRKEILSIGKGHKKVYKKLINEGKSAASFCHKVAAWVPDMLSNFYFVKNHQIPKTSTTKAREKISTDSESYHLRKLLMYV